MDDFVNTTTTGPRKLILARLTMWVVAFTNKAKVLVVDGRKLNSLFQLFLYKNRMMRQINGLGQIYKKGKECLKFSKKTSGIFLKRGF